MLKQKKIWDIVKGSKVEFITTAQNKKKDKDNAIASKIIKQRINSNFHINIIGQLNLYQY